MMAKMSTVSLPPASSGLDYKEEYNTTECPFRDAPPGTIYSITLLICLFGLVGNGTVLWCLSFHIKRNPFTVYILNLAVSDTCFLLCWTVYLIASAVEHSLCWNSDFIFIIYSVIILALFMYSTSLYLVTAISMERCLAVLYPIWHRCHRPKHLSALVSAFLWALSMLVCCLGCVLCIVLSDVNCNISFLTICVLNLLIFTPIMVLSSLTLFIKVQCSSQRRQPGKLYAIIVLTVLFFLLFTIPWSIQIFLSYHGIFDSTGIFHILTCASSGINPYIYFLVGSYGKQRFCGSIKVALQRVFEEKDSTEDGEATNAEPLETVT